MTLQIPQLANLLRVLMIYLQQHAGLRDDRAKAQFWKDANASAGRAINEGRGLMYNGRWIPGGAEAFNHLRGEGSSDVSLEIIEGLVAIIAQMMTTVNRSKYDADLVDLMAKFLTSTRFQSNALSGAALSALRRAILLPGELKELNDTLRMSFACPRCARKLTGFRHLAVLSDGDGEREVHCIHCSGVQATSCATEGCEEEVELTKEDFTMIQKLIGKKCEKHGGPAREERPRGPRVAQARGADIFANILRQRVPPARVSAEWDPEPLAEPED